MAIRAAALASLCFLSSALAQGEIATHLEYDRGPGAEDCPDGPSLRSAVAELLRYNPFAETSRRTIRARVTRARGGFEAVIDLQDAAGAWRGVRRLGSAQPTCEQLAAALALALAIAIDPLMAGPPEAPPSDAPSASPAAETPAPAASTDDEPPPLDSPAATLLALSAHAAGGAAPGFAPGFELLIGRRRGRASFNFAARLDLPAYQETGDPEGGKVSGWVALGSALACLHHGVLAGCAAIGGGARSLAGHELDEARRVTRPMAVAGARAAVQIPLRQSLAIYLHVDLLGEIVETTVRVGGRKIWDTPPVSGAAGAGFVAKFP